MQKTKPIEIQEPAWEGFDSEPESSADKEPGDSEADSHRGSGESEEDSVSDLESEENLSSESEVETKKKIKHSAI